MGKVIVTIMACGLVVAGCANSGTNDETTSERVNEGAVTTSEAEPSTTQRVANSPTTESSDTSSTSTEPVLPTASPDLAAFASTVGANTVIARANSSLYVYTNGVETSSPVTDMDWIWSDGDFIYRAVAEGGKTLLANASLLDGTVVCETNSPLHHATQRSDGSYVMAVFEHEIETQKNWDDHSPYEIPLFAVDCQTGESQPIASVQTLGLGETETGFIERVAGREFTGFGDAEGNAHMINEQGTSLDGEDYAGYHTFNHDGSLVAYGDMKAMAGPHYSNVVKVRDTASGELLWEVELPQAFMNLQFFDNRLLIELFELGGSAGGFEHGEYVVAYDAFSGIEQAVAELDFALLYVGG